MLEIKKLGDWLAVTDYEFTLQAIGTGLEVHGPQVLSQASLKHIVQV